MNTPKEIKTAQTRRWIRGFSSCTPNFSFYTPNFL